MASDAAAPATAGARADGDGPPVRDAATIILIERNAGAPRVLMGQRGKAAAFMPEMFVFPGGALEAGDLELAEAAPADPETAARLAVETAPEVARALPLTAIRELWEETGLRLGRPDPGAAARAAAAPETWRGFLAAGLTPSTDALRLIFRAVTPPGRPRRFDARFFLAEAEGLASGAMDFAFVDHELSALQWIELEAARRLPLPFITQVVIAELESHLEDPAAPRPVPWFVHDARGSHVRMI